MRKIDLADAGFLYLEKREIPMHVGGLFLCTLPEGVEQQEFMSDLDACLRNVDEFREPFGEYVTTGKAGPLGGLYWEKDEHLDFDYHVRHSALPQPGRYRELFALVARLHGTLLDRSRPLWEAHLIEGLQNRQFALYMKLHHATTDGIGALQIVNGMCSTNKKTRLDFSPLSMAARQRLNEQSPHRQLPRAQPKKSELKAVLDVLKQQFDSSINVAGVMADYAKAVVGMGGDLALPWLKVPRTPISARISGSRRFVAQSWGLDRIKAVGEAMDGTVNDVVLAMCSGALRRYLQANQGLPKQSLKSLVPVSVRDEGRANAGNAISFITADLATNTQDPEKRFREIQASINAGKQVLDGLSASEAALLWQLISAPSMITSLLGISDRVPTFNLTISNVPGSRKPLYWNGARLDGIYPVNIPFDGMAMSITLLSYNNKLDFGLIACRRSVPGLQKMIVYMEESLTELEEAAAIKVA